jgi:hypothetical protein
MTLQEMVMNKAAAWTWAMDWADQGRTGVRQLQETAAKIKARYCTDGLWNPDAQSVHLYLTEAAQMAQECDCQCPSPASGVALRSMECPLHNDDPQARES